MRSNLVITILLLTMLADAFGQTLSETQMRNARATGYAIVAARNPGKNFSIYVIPWDGVNSLEYNANAQINSGWHAQGAVKGNFLDQTFNGSDFSQYSSVVISQADFDLYKGTGTQWWIVCSTLPSFSNSALIIESNGNVRIKSGDNNSRNILTMHSGAGSYEVTNNRLAFSGTENITAGNPYGFRKDVQWLVGQEAGLNFTFRYGPSETELLRIQGDGNVGIGTAQPRQKLHVKGRFYLEGTEAYPSGWQQSYFHWKGHSLIMGSEVGEYAHNTIELKAGGASNGPLATSFQMFQTPSPNNYEMKVQLSSNGSSFLNGGNVGIGTTTPDAKLTVDGNVKCEEVKVEIFQGTGPDYVFEKDYNLTPLSELETYITQNKHLPEVPSAKEMEADGLNLKEMNLLLLKKVEELTLHLIEMKKEVGQLQKDNQNLKTITQDNK